MTNLKSITELPLAESADGLNLIVNDNGAAKQLPANKVGKVKTVNGVSPDTNGNIRLDTASSTVSSWNDLKDKPFYEEEAIEVYLDTEFTVIDRGIAYIDVSNIPWEYESYLYVLLDGVEYYCQCLNDVDECMGIFIPTRDYDTEVNGGYRTLPYLALEGGYINFNPINFEEDRKFTDGNPHTLKVYNKISTIHKLDAKYLPSIGGYDLVIAGRENGTVLLHGTYDDIYTKMMNNIIPSVVYLESYYLAQSDRPGGCVFGRISSLDFSSDPERFEFGIGESNATRVILHKDNTVEWFEYMD